MFSLAYFIYSHSKEEEDFEKLKETVGIILKAFISNAKTIENLGKIEKAKIIQYLLEGKNEDLLEGFFSRTEKADGQGGYLWHHHGLCIQLIYSMEETRDIIHRGLYILANTGEYRLAALVTLRVIEAQGISYISFAKKLLSAGIDQRHLILIADAASNPKAEEYLRILCNEGNCI